MKIKPGLLPFAFIFGANALALLLITNARLHPKPPIEPVTSICTWQYPIATLTTDDGQGQTSTVISQCGQWETFDHAVDRASWLKNHPKYQATNP